LVIRLSETSADIPKHRQHSPPCNPDLKLNSHMAAVGLGLGVNAGLPGIGEEGMM
jgi:transcription factor SFP1